MQIPGFVGGSNVLDSTLVDCEVSINLRPIGAQPGTPKVPAYLARTPGLDFKFNLEALRVSAGFTINGRTFIVADDQFVEQFEGDTFIVRGTVATQTTAFPVATMCSNGTAGDQVAVCSGGYVYIFTLSTDAFAIVADMDLNQGEIQMIEFFGGYFFALWTESRTFQWSALEDGTDWDSLDVAERSWAADNISFLMRNGTHIWLVGTQTSEVWYATGGIEVFAPAQESLIEHGCIAPFSRARVAGTLVWLDQDERGGGTVVMAKGLQPEQISTTAIAIYEQQRSGNLAYAIGVTYQLDGHLYYVLQGNDNAFPFTPCYDVTEGIWHYLASWDSTACVWRNWRGQCHWYAFERHFIGDRLTGAVYEMSMRFLTETLADVA